MAKVKVKQKAAAKPTKSKPAAKSAKPVAKARPKSSPKIEVKPAKKKIEVVPVKAAKPVSAVKPVASPKPISKPVAKSAPIQKGPVQKEPMKFEPPKPPKKLTAEMQQIREKLIVMLADFRKEIDHEIRGASERDLAHINDTSDMATDAAEGDLALRIAESETVEAAEVERAIEKIDMGTYGLCELCNTRIPIERLQVLPFATQCVKCQELADIRKRARGGDELDDLNTDGGDMEE